MKNILTRRNILITSAALTTVGCTHQYDIPQDNISKLRHDIDVFFDGAEPDKHEKLVTARFAQYQKDYPILRRLRRSVGLIQFKTPGTNDLKSEGSAVLGSIRGDLCMSGHQVVDANLDVNALFAATPLGEDYSRAPIHRNIFTEERQDFAIADMDASVIKKAGLDPVTWGHLQDSDIGRDVFLLGFFRGNLHAELGKIVSYHQSVVAFDAKGLRRTLECKYKVNQVVFPGLSGGLVFSIEDGRFLAVINASNDNISDPQTYITSTDTIFAALDRQFPQRARAIYPIGYSSYRSASHPECRPEMLTHS